MSIFDEDKNENVVRGDPKGPFIPLAPGPYAALGKELGTDLTKMATEAFAGHKAGEAAAGIMAGVNQAAGDPIGKAGGAVGEGLGWWADNLSNIAENAKILLDKANDPNWWGFNNEPWR